MPILGHLHHRRLSKKRRSSPIHEEAQERKSGQPGHEKHILTLPEDSRVTQRAEHGDGDDGFACPDCCIQFRFVIELRLKEDFQYGSMVQAMVLSLMDTVNAPVNKTGMVLGFDR